MEPSSASFTLMDLGGDEIRSGDATVIDHIVTVQVFSYDFDTRDRILLSLSANANGSIYPGRGFVHLVMS